MNVEKLKEKMKKIIEFVKTHEQLVVSSLTFIFMVAIVMTYLNLGSEIKSLKKENSTLSEKITEVDSQKQISSEILASLRAIGQINTELVVQLKSLAAYNETLVDGIAQVKLEQENMRNDLNELNSMSDAVASDHKAIDKNSSDIEKISAELSALKGSKATINEDVLDESFFKEAVPPTDRWKIIKPWKWF